MNETLTLVLAGVEGTALGAMFFGGLWWTVRRAVSSPRPALWVFGSLLLRMSIALSGLHVVAGGHWERLLACLAGFFVARQFATWSTRPPRDDRDCVPDEASHAP
ncbi:MAG: ATP synthase subunit I [Betaproteobacteria bacterium]|nr:ATP synthase subunit I [Betaproteobacteria bacterium]